MKSKRPQSAPESAREQLRRRKKKRRARKAAAIVLCAALAALCAAAALLWPGAVQAFAPASSLPQTGSQSEAASSAPQPQPVVSTVRFSATGDNLIHDGIYLQAHQRTGGDGYDFGPLYENLTEFYAGFDLNWINQETLVTDEIAPSSYPQFCTPGACGQAIYDLGMRVISMSNNHSYDKYAEGIAATQRFWASMPDDLVTTGLWAGPKDYENIPTLEKNGITFAFLAYTETTNGIPTPADAPANVIYTSEEDVIERQIRRAREVADVVVVGAHWGVEGSHTVSDAQRALAQKMADWGADVIIGTHPHVVQGIEILQSERGAAVPVAYSLGNFVSTQQYADNMISIIFTFDVTKTVQPDGAQSIAIDNIRAVPAVTHYDAGFANVREYLYRDYTPELAAQHGTRAYSARFDYDYIREMLLENIDESYLQWD